MSIFSTKPPTFPSERYDGDRLAGTSKVLLFARKIRHAPGLSRLDKLWSCLRPAYHRWLDRFYRKEGIPISVGQASILHAPASFAHNQIDPHEILFLGKLMSEAGPDTCFYDIGASIGLHSIAVGEKLGASGEIHGFEPDSSSVAHYRSNTRLLRRRRISMYLHRCFVAEKSRGFSPAGARVDLSPQPSATDLTQSKHLYFFEAGPQSTLPIVSLDDYVGAGARPPTLIKCDIEGAELLMLRGARHILRRHRPLLFISLHPTLIKAFDHSETAFFAELTDSGYRWEIIDEDGETHLIARPLESFGL